MADCGKTQNSIHRTDSSNNSKFKKGFKRRSFLCLWVTHPSTFWPLKATQRLLTQASILVYIGTKQNCFTVRKNATVLYDRAVGLYTNSRKARYTSESDLCSSVPQSTALRSTRPVPHHITYRRRHKPLFRSLNLLLTSNTLQRRTQNAEECTGSCIKLNSFYTQPAHTSQPSMVGTAFCVWVCWNMYVYYSIGNTFE